MEALKMALAILLSVLIALSAFVWLIGFNLEQTVMQPDFYIRALSQNAFFDQLINLVVSDFRQHFLVDVPPASQDLVTAAISEGLNPVWAREQAANLTGNLLGYLKSESPSISLVLSLEGIKETVTGAVRRNLSQNQPKQLDLLVKGFNESISDQVDVMDLVGRPDLSQVRQVVGWERSIVKISLPAALILGTLLWLLMGRSVPALQLPGISLLVAGASGTGALWADHPRSACCLT